MTSNRLVLSLTLSLASLVAACLASEDDANPDAALTDADMTDTASSDGGTDADSSPDADPSDVPAPDAGDGESTDTDVGEPTVGPSCASNEIGVCDLDEICTHSGTGYCREYISGHCEPVPTDCAGVPSLEGTNWRLCGCSGELDEASVCEARAARIRDRLVVCYAGDGVPCDLTAPAPCTEGICVPSSSCSEFACTGVCVAEDTCTDADIGTVCATYAPNTGVVDALSQCWASVCEALEDGYDGPLAAVGEGFPVE